MDPSPTRDREELEPETRAFPDADDPETSRSESDEGIPPPPPPPLRQQLTEGRDSNALCISSRWAWQVRRFYCSYPSIHRVNGVAGPRDDDDLGMLDELVDETC
ncbi:hypothetical protein BDA96_04G213200 [Sorghum bicolor]|jgi:hypothetical protein|uniref:Uncharacterized protein n=2 Tax=Sorghum bicolor TaxID=4558 RepID=A0A921R5I2_SORBI|nr:hypothetical protein BDA96_04G213200 [Sorghum bicolor]OQU85239.1 hypothetical protein SORBI_3004G200501 [Sorghum bicolor]